MPRTPRANTHRFVALLRGINVGGKNMLPMADLSPMFVAAGCADVRTYIQSGNVLFSATPEAATRVPQYVSAQIAKKFGFSPVLVMRTADEIIQIASNHPFLKPGGDTKPLFVGFFAHMPEKKLIATLNPDRSPGDSFTVRGREVYFHLGSGAAKTKLTNAYFDSALSTTSTFRNWQTVQKLAELSRAQSE